MPRVRNRPFNILMNDDERNALDALAHQTGFSRGLIIRRLILSAAKHSIQGHPTCANGSPCFVPQMHAHPQAQPAQQILPPVPPDSDLA